MNAQAISPNLGTNLRFAAGIKGNAKCVVEIVVMVILRSEKWSALRTGVSGEFTMRIRANQITQVLETQRDQVLSAFVALIRQWY